MQEKLEELVKAVYKKWKADTTAVLDAHPDDNAIACFMEHKLSLEESEVLKFHLLKCPDCLDRIITQLSIVMSGQKDIPNELVEFVKNLVPQEILGSVLEVFLKLQEKTLEVLSTTGDILVGQEFVPVPLLRSRNIRDFQDEITILKDFAKVRVEARIENKQGTSFSLTVIVKDKATQKIIKDLRVTLMREDLELESYLTDSGKVIFENVELGKYTVEINTIDQRIASILLDIKI